MDGMEQTCKTQAKFPHLLRPLQRLQKRAIDYSRLFQPFEAL